MSLLNKATIITTPTAHSNGKLHSIKGGAVADFDVVRGSAATRVNAEGLIESVATNIPRIDYTTGEGVILTEPQSTNLVTYSEDFSQASWLSSNGSITLNYATSPSGENNASRWLSSPSTTSVLTVGTTVSNNTTYTISFYAKSNGNNKDSFRLLISSGSDGLTSNDMTATSEWQKFTYTGTRLISGSRFGIIFPSDNSEVDLQIWGAQLEALPYSTSYIPTSGAIATRLADVVTGAGDATTINSIEGVLYAEIAALANDGGFRLISLSNETSQNTVQVYYSNTSNRITGEIKVGGATQASFNYTASDVTDIHKIAFKYKENDFALWVDGVEIGTDVSGSVFETNTLNKLSLHTGTGSLNFYGKTKTIAVFSEALTDEELTCLTTI